MNQPRVPSLLLAAVLWACAPVASPGPGPASPPGPTAPALTGDGCALHLTADACRADTGRGCTWDSASLSCVSGQASDGGATAPACSCPPGLACAVQLAGTVSLSTDQITCASLLPGCTPSGPCTCLSGQGKCLPSPTISGLCLCDDLRQ
jgi:hypothetical protein